MPIVPFLRDEVFEPHDIKAMGEALEQASHALGIAHDDMLVRQELARRIIFAAKTGMRDPDKLALHALKGLGVELAVLARAASGDAA